MTKNRIKIERAVVKWQLCELGTVTSGAPCRYERFKNFYFFFKNVYFFNRFLVLNREIRLRVFCTISFALISYLRIDYF